MPIRIIGVETKCFTFPSGERHVQLLSPLPPENVPPTVVMDYRSSDDIMDWLLIDSIMKQHGRKYCLDAPYLPFSRQDRYTDANSPFSLEVFHSLVQMSNVVRLRTTDLHSDVLLNKLDRPYELSNIPMHVALAELLPELVDVESVASPDKGALHKVDQCADLLKVPMTFWGNKKRDVQTGKILSMTVEASDGPLPLGPILVCDDICDGGGTFIELAQKIKAHPNYGDQPLWLYVTHGLFTRGKQVLLDAGYEKIFSFCERN